MTYYDGFRELAPFLAAAGVIIAAVFSYRQAERQKMREATNPALVAHAAAGAYAHDTSSRDLIEAITLLTTMMTKLVVLLEKDADRRERSAELAELMYALRKEQK